MTTEIIEHLFTQKLNTVSSLTDCVMQAIQSELSQHAAPLDSEIETIVNALRIVADSVEADGKKRQLAGLEPAYHNRQHVTEVLISLQMLLGMQELLPMKYHLSLKERLLILIAVTGHDYLHDGGVNGSVNEAEKLSADAVVVLLIQNGVSETDAAYVHDLIMATSRTLVVTNHQLSRSHPEMIDALLLSKLLMSEADIFASLMPSYGVLCGKKLSEESVKARNENATFIESDEGRRYFLSNSFISSPHAKALKLDQVIAQQIE